MLSRIWNVIIIEYKAFFGNGALFALFAVCLGILCVSDLRKKGNVRRTLVPYIFTIWGTIGILFAKVFLGKISDSSIEENGSEQSDTIERDNIRDTEASDNCETAADDAASGKKSVMSRIVIAVLLVFVLIISGKRIASGDYYTKADNSMHISDDMLEVMDTILAGDDSELIGIVTMPGYGGWFESYSSRFTTLYKDPVSGSLDDKVYDKKIRAAYGELCDIYPDMRTISDAARANGCKYIILRSEAYWPKQPLTDFEYDIIATCGEWNVYKSTREVAAE